jgi:hypothetical protein
LYQLALDRLSPGVTARYAVVHVGTHKPGTTALQVFLAVNRPLLETAGIHYPRAGRHDLGDGMMTPGHHQIAMDYLAGESSASLGAILTEIAAVDASAVVLSSEEFQMLVPRAGALDAIAGGLRERGYVPVAIVYLRAQPYYAESVYAEMIKGGWLTDFDAYLETIVADGAFTPPGSTRTMTFDYQRLIAQLEAPFGNVIARAYRSDASDDALARDFLQLVGGLRGSLKVEGLKNPMPRANESQTLRQLIASLYAIAGRPEELPSDVAADELDERFALLTRGDVSRFYKRFADGNAAINARFGIGIPFAAASDVPAREDPRFLRARRHREILSRIIAALGLL